jgi:hypothetical protein
VATPFDRDEHFVQESSVPQSASPALRCARVRRPELAAPLPHRLVRDQDPPLGHHVLNIAKTQAEVVIQPHHVG